MKRLLLAFSLFFAIPVNAAEITSRITDSVQLKALILQVKHLLSQKVLMLRILLLPLKQ